LNSGVFPDEWKIPRVKPLYKKGDRYDIQNYKPMSVLSVFSKILERLIHFLSNSRIFMEAQNGFRKGKCIETTIQSFIERIQEALDKGLHMIAIFFYLTKAYDVLNHRISLEKLYCYGIRGSTNSWFQTGIGPLIRK
jgi:hypothetical protein